MRLFITSVRALCLFSCFIAGLLFIATHSGHATSVEVVDNGNKVTNLSQPNILKFQVDWYNAEPILFKVHSAKTVSTSELAVSGMANNKGLSDWCAIHVTLDRGAKWAVHVRHYISGGKGSVDIKNEVNSVTAWDGRIDKIGKHAEIPFIDRLRKIKANFADIAFFPPLPVQGRLVLGAVIDQPIQDRNTGSDWIIDTRDVPPGGIFTIKIQPIIKSEYRLIEPVNGIYNSDLKNCNANHSP